MRSLDIVLVDAVHGAFVYVPTFHDACINKIYSALGKLLKTTFPDAGQLRLYSIAKAKLSLEQKPGINYLNVPSFHFPMDSCVSSSASELRSFTPDAKELYDRPASNISQSRAFLDTKYIGKRDHSSCHSASKSKTNGLIVYGKDRWTRKIPQVTVTILDDSPSPEASILLSPEVRSPVFNYELLDGSSIETCSNSDKEDTFSTSESVNLRSEHVHEPPTEDFISDILPDKKTSYMLFKNRGEKPRMINWPLDSDDETLSTRLTPESGLSLFEDDSEGHVPISACFSDIDLMSDSSF